MIHDKFSSLHSICEKYDIGLVYLFGSQQEQAYQLLKNNTEHITIDDPLTDIDEYEMSILRHAADFKYVLDLYTKEVLEKY
ncbi:MAG: hypothetical protein GX024_08790 [Clostridiales bacterium]|nr:hypothetical protein [Clostridiales bacterium]